MPLDNSFTLAIFAIAITLSAYLSAIRMVAIQKIDELVSDDPKETDPAVKASTKAKARKEKWKLTKKLGWLTLADAPMVLSAFFLGLHLLWYRPGLVRVWDNLFPGNPYLWFRNTGLWLFFIAGTIMLVMHVVAWYRTYCALVEGEEQSPQDEAIVNTSEAVVPVPDAENQEGE